jgi:hypothetical protein
MVRKKTQAVSAAQDWRDRMAAARKKIPEKIGQQDVVAWVVEQQPDLNKLTNATRWRNAWLSRVADPEITQLVELAADHFSVADSKTSKLLKRQKLVKKV